MPYDLGPHIEVQFGDINAVVRFRFDEYIKPSVARHIGGLGPTFFVLGGSGGVPAEFRILTFFSFIRQNRPLFSPYRMGVSIIIPKMSVPCLRDSNVPRLGDRYVPCMGDISFVSNLEKSLGLILQDTFHLCGSRTGI